jgi:hypothetical protein
MTHRSIKTIDGGSPEYWPQRKIAFALIREAERAARALQGAPMYIAGDWDDDYGDYEPVENLAPFDRMDEAIAAIEADETAVSILVAQRREWIGNHRVSAVSRVLHSDEDPEGDYELLHGPDR